MKKKRADLNQNKVGIMLFCRTKIVKLFLSGIFILMASISSHADEGVIYYGRNVKIYGKENIYTKPNPSQKIAKVAPKTKRKTIEPVKNEVVEKKLPKEIVFPDFPFSPSSLYYSYISKELAVPVSPQRLHDYQTICKGNHGNTHSRVENSSLSLYLPEQRHKFSTAATQCGILTSFIPNSPPL